MQDYITYKRLFTSHIDFLDKVSTTVEPTSYAQASQDLGWVQAMDKKLSTLKLNDTWDIVPRPMNKKVIDSRWV